MKLLPRHALAALLALPLVACQPQASDTISITDAWVRLPAVQGRPGAAYFTVKGGPADDRLVAIKSAVVGRIELHEGGMHGGMMTMRPLAEVPVPAGKPVEFNPGGNHAMLFDIDARITPGTELPLAFVLASGKTVEVEAKSVAAGDAAPAP